MLIEEKLDDLLLDLNIFISSSSGALHRRLDFKVGSMSCYKGHETEVPGILWKNRKVCSICCNWVSLIFNVFELGFSVPLVV
jgi:hypothetical protein